MPQENDIKAEFQELAPSLAGVGNGMPYSVPHDYFDHFAELMLRKMKALDAEDARQETSLLSPTLEGVSRKMPFAVPEGYFEKLAPAADGGRAPAKIVPMRGLKRVWKYAVAAAVAGLIATGLFLFRGPRESSADQQLALKDSSTILQEISTISKGEMEAYASDVAEAEPMTDPELSDDPALMFAEISDAELENYLN